MAADEAPWAPIAEELKAASMRRKLPALLHVSKKISTEKTAIGSILEQHAVWATNQAKAAAKHGDVQQTVEFCHTARASLHARHTIINHNANGQVTLDAMALAIANNGIQ